ncbi:BQ2448_598 [Microbotryum intermedium]|uniref:Extracellular metalloproteinase n=1 Tax=Microbotryum intermedium TaxID=269621 RepID=A0A238F5W5_9BASI|nr:BQ2448_598 [Microbotryum intermedium]
MIYPQQRRRQQKVVTPGRIALAAGLASALSVQAIALPAAAAGARPSAIVGESTPRKSINFGPHVPAKHHTSASPDASIAMWNASPFKASFGVVPSALQLDGASSTASNIVGAAVAQAFVESLHPSSQFRLVNGYVSKHTNVYHAHFLETIGGIDVANGNVNVNIDLDSNEIVSYGDSSYASSNVGSSSSSSAASWKAKVASWAAEAEESAVEALNAASQTVFGENGPQNQKSHHLEMYASPPLVPEGKMTRVVRKVSTKPNDPRHGLLTFLAVQSPNSDLSDLLVSAPPAELVDSLKVERVDGAAHTHTILNAPSVLEPVKATLTYVHDGKKLQLAWKYEILSDDNQYEAYVQADATVSGDEEVFLVVDWVRDYRPTGGEMGLEALMTPMALGKRSKLGGTFGGQRKPFNVRKGRVGTVIGGSTHEADALLRNLAAPTVPDKDAKPSYKVFPWGENDPTEGKRELLSGKKLLMDAEASPSGWHTVESEFEREKAIVYSDTRGNNVFAQDNVDGGNSRNGHRPSGGKSLTFDFKLGWPKPGTPLEPSSTFTFIVGALLIIFREVRTSHLAEYSSLFPLFTRAAYIDAAITELFYTNNLIHDLFYRYGFDEVSGNFQENNFGRGGRGGDAVQANAQDGSGQNNANFATPPDGQRPCMRMYYWTGSQPYRDGDFEAGIVIHEYAHGISTRLTGGSAQSGCLGWGEAGGMGEGWGDYFASTIRMIAANQTDVTMGEWASSRTGGIRNYPYTLNLTTNLDTYKSLDKPGYWGVHAIGEVWAEMCWEMMHNLIKKHGWESSLFPPAPADADKSGFYNPNYKKKVPAKGNTLALQLVVDGLKLQPCRPTFQNARDAILAADKALTGGDNQCEIWKAFSKRGLGPDAVVTGSTPWGGGVRTEDYKLPKTCSKSS